MRTDLTSCKSVARLAQTILQALNPSYAEHSPVTSIDRGVFVSATWGRCGNLAQAQGMGEKSDGLTLNRLLKTVRKGKHLIQEY